jgi:hypothetical protein
MQDNSNSAQTSRNKDHGRSPMPSPHHEPGVMETTAAAPCFRPMTNMGAPYLAVFGEMWDSTALTPNCFLYRPITSGVILVPSSQ